MARRVISGWWFPALFALAIGIYWGGHLFAAGRVTCTVDFTGVTE